MSYLPALRKPSPTCGVRIFPSKRCVRILSASLLQKVPNPKRHHLCTKCIPDYEIEEELLHKGSDRTFLLVVWSGILEILSYNLLKELVSRRYTISIGEPSVETLKSIKKITSQIYNISPVTLTLISRRLLLNTVRKPSRRTMNMHVLAISMAVTYSLITSRGAWVVMRDLETAVSETLKSEDAPAEPSAELARAVIDRICHSISHRHAKVKKLLHQFWKKVRS